MRLALTPATRPVGLAAEAVPAVLRDLEIWSGTAADYDAWLGGVP